MLLFYQIFQKFQLHPHTQYAYLLQKGNTFNYQGDNFTIINSGKPTCVKGEPKTDIYVEAESEYGDIIEIKKQLREEAEKLGINHLTIEFEKEGEICCAPVCRIENSKKCSHHHHH